MIHITRIKPTSNFIRDVESMFDLHVSPKDFTGDDLEAIKEIDNAELLDIETGLIKTPFGLTSITNLSTGCKTILVYNYCKRNNINKVINVNECGANGLDLLFKFMVKNNDNVTKLYLRHENGLCDIGNYDFDVDGERGEMLCLL